MQKVIYKFGMTSCIPFDLEKTMNVINIKKSYGKKEILKNGYSLRKDYKNIKSEYVTELLERARNDLNK